MHSTTADSDFSKGSVRGNILRLAGPMTLAQLINLLYNIIDRMYIGHLPENSTPALTGLGLTFHHHHCDGLFQSLRNGRITSVLHRPGKTR